MYIFPVRCSGDEKLKYIFPSKQRAAQKAIELAQADDRIRRLIIFGSSTTLNCGIESDIDIAIDAPNINTDEFISLAHPFLSEIPSEVDVIHYNNIHSELLMEEIKTKGVIIYDNRISTVN